MRKKLSPRDDSPASDSGIYRDDPRVMIPLKTAKAWSAFEQRTTQQLFDLMILLSEAEKFAQEVLAKFTLHGQTLSPSHAKGIPANVKRQVHYAKYLRSQAAMTRQAVELGDAMKAAAHAFWVGRYHEALRVCGVEHIAATGRKVRHGARIGHAKTHGAAKEKTARWDQFQKTIDKLHKDFPSWSYKKLCLEAARHHGCDARTIERHTINPRKKSSDSPATVALFRE